MLLKKLGLLLVLVIFLFGCTEKTMDQLDPKEEASKGIFYKVTHEENTVYLLGSIHIGIPALYPLADEIDAAYKASDYLAVEVNVNDLNQTEMMKLLSEIGIYNDGTTIEDHIASELYDELLQTLRNLGLQAEAVTLFKPWLVSDMVEAALLEEAGYSSDLGIDQYFLRKAVDDNKEIISLETVKQQLDLYTLLSPESQEQALYSTLFEQETNQEKIAELMSLWTSGDIQALSKLRILEGEQSQDFLEYFYALTDERDLKMTEKIEDFLKNESSETYFVVVGALHLVGENSIVDLLQSRGYDVKPMFE
ncbi:TraB/GumN family protein [Anaerobacillus sp. CMMVII]|uniref:TraB/GumN family protein n=1 Tax=Anaerobacillus sp. CMMVII TaxID=2755588 RepID=UPI0021B80A5A|nr:TraB/GumN family protein [Anaerobacillus sp. CMMVII]MCT8138121.1 TraB/GumN family protein [Anaerobacillus sp. CMMVII]